MDVVDGFDAVSVERAVELLRRGDVVAFPTETVYGLGADGLNPYAVARIFELKKRPRFDPLILHVAHRDWIGAIVKEIPRGAVRVMERFWPGPLTLILEKKSEVPDIVTAGLQTVALRMPSHPVALRLIGGLGRPVAAPSANPFGYMSPTRAAHVARLFRDKPGLILDGGSSTFGIESTIISFRGEAVYVHRHGAVTVEELRDLLGEVREKEDGTICEAPGELPFHYAPHHPLKIVAGPGEIGEPKSAFLAFRTPDEAPPSAYIRVLSPEGDLREAAANFFSSLIELDREDVSVIYAERIPEEGIGKAMMERLRKAARKFGHITH